MEVWTEGDKARVNPSLTNTQGSWAGETWGVDKGWGGQKQVWRILEQEQLAPK